MAFHVRGRPLGLRPLSGFLVRLQFCRQSLLRFHRFHRATVFVKQRQDETWTPEPLNNSTEARAFRCNWVANNADLVATVHVLRVELQIRYVVQHIVHCTPDEPFLFWLDFEWGANGLPHGHGKNYVSGNPSYEASVDDEDSRMEMIARGHSEAHKLQTRDEAETALGTFLRSLRQRMAPCQRR